MQTTKERYLSRKQVSKILSVSLPTVDSLSQAGKLIAYKVGEKLVRYKASEVESVLTKG